MIERQTVVHQANALQELMGQKSEAVAAARAIREREAGHTDEANNWDQIRNLLQERRAPRQG
ncbi:hypothetical protein [Jannaschia seohaensis]|uniref:Uncharacterized protein n=1 Tax=Jannaschia seohaensis TaxID=475081 RepID=A0A2Y9APA7_9RHOB|nr:hypothetical protein [Jannaschia seohaensis]PWJ19264.1 hypothetical protein BCF38_104198 [Jannaschia seohaensis]SSA45926.1 hypothetical protein SAMN05421539_104198 [Jannaschia seohaensis]